VTVLVIRSEVGIKLFGEEEKMVDESLDKSDLLKAEKWAKTGKDSKFGVCSSSSRKNTQGCWRLVSRRPCKYIPDL
jgi:hypothetical protein